MKKGERMTAEQKAARKAKAETNKALKDEQKRLERRLGEIHELLTADRRQKYEAKRRQKEEERERRTKECNGDGWSETVWDWLSRLWQVPPVPELFRSSPLYQELHQLVSVNHPKDNSAVISKWRKEKARVHHPDKFGNDMSLVNAIADWFLAQL
jgi:hypothetical protein